MAEKPNVYVTRNVPEAVAERLHGDYAARVDTTDSHHGPDDIVNGARGMDAIVVTPPDKLTAEVIQRLPDSVKAIVCFSIGTDHVDLDAAKAKGLIVTNTPGVLTDATADIAMLLILGASRRAYEGQQMLRGREWTGWRPTQLMGVGLQGKRLGLLGIGRIGHAVAQRAPAFGMEVHYHDLQRLPADKENGAIYHETPEDLLKVADILSLHVPATPKTKGFLNNERIGLLPENAIVVNTARGDIVDDEALIHALQTGRIFAAGLDVFAGEPNIHEGYYALENAYLLPHLGSATVETRNAMGFMCLDNMDAIFSGKEPPNRVV